MTLLYTLTVGTLLWWLGTESRDSRATMGIGGPWIHAFVFVLVALLVARSTRLRAAAAEARPVYGTTPQPGGPLARWAARSPSRSAIVGALRYAAGLSLVVAIAFELLDIGDSGLSTLIRAAELALWATPVALVVGALGTRLGPAAARTPPRHTPAQAVMALAPLLVPLAAMFLLRAIEPSPW